MIKKAFQWIFFILVFVPLLVLGWVVEWISPNTYGGGSWPL